MKHHKKESGGRDIISDLGWEQSPEWNGEISSDTFLKKYVGALEKKREDINQTIKETKEMIQSYAEIIKKKEWKGPYVSHYHETYQDDPGMGRVFYTFSAYRPFSEKEMIKAIKREEREKKRALKAARTYAKQMKAGLRSLIKEHPELAKEIIDEQ